MRMFIKEKSKKTLEIQYQHFQEGKENLLRLLTIVLEK